MTELPAVSSFGCGRQCSWQHSKHRDSEALQKHAHHSATLASGADMAAGTDQTLASSFVTTRY
ncbi:hypothetical protein HPB50_010948 [Hyalomma asiaticum]|uniref:Uncharacterized protein n=1 Tax=Hyalomma asiaticum TaxID=266040 RepID=A0ACB7SXP3_HYAAI|nr:hypothetical protein HPB50_010948 [Hyalomma asiaticum]